MSQKKRNEAKEVVGFLGIGLDNKDGHQRITQSEHFVLIGGSQETHESMQDVAIRFDEQLGTKGKKLQDVTPEEIIEIFTAVRE